MVEYKSEKDQKTEKSNLDKNFQSVQEKTGTSRQEKITDSDDHKKINQ